MSNPANDIYEKIIALLEQNQANFRVVEHAPEGQTEPVSRMRGNLLSQAVKSLVVLVKIGKKESRYYLANIPGDSRVDLNVIKTLCNATRVMFAPAEKARQLTGCVMGAVPPFSFNQNLIVLADPSLFENDELVFNAGRLDRSIFMDKDSYLRIAQPNLVPIAMKEIKESQI